MARHPTQSNAGRTRERLSESGGGGTLGASEVRTSSEGRILRLGLVLAVVYLVLLGAAWVVQPAQASLLGALTALNLVLGRAAGMSFGYAGGLDPWLVVSVSMFVETIQVMVLFPLFVFSWGHLVEVRGLKRLMEKMRGAAEAHRETIRRFGMAGLFAFVLLPFWMTGPVVGAALGFLIGLRPWANLSIVLGATYIAILLWSWALRGLHGWAAAYHQYAPFGIVAAVILAVLVAGVLRQRRRR